MAIARGTSSQISARTTYCCERLANGAVTSPRPYSGPGHDYKCLCRRAFLVLPPLYQSMDNNVPKTASRQLAGYSTRSHYGSGKE